MNEPITVLVHGEGRPAGPSGGIRLGAAKPHLAELGLSMLAEGCEGRDVRGTWLAPDSPQALRLREAYPSNPVWQLLDRAPGRRVLLVVVVMPRRFDA